MRRRDASDGNRPAASGPEERSPSALPSPAHFFRRTWDEYDEEERAHHAYQARVDYCGLAALTVLYGLTAWAVAPEQPLPEVPAGVFLVQLIFAALAFHNLYMELFVIVRVVKADKSNFLVGKGPLGRWIWMTHQAIGAQAVHYAVSLLAPLLSNRLALVTYRVSMPLGGIGAFVTSQFFFLVYPTSTFDEECEVWARRVPAYRFVQSYLHVPQLLLALADVCLIKHRSTLLLISPSVPTIVLLYAAYCITYLSVVRANHALTGCWPYGIVASLGDSAMRWLQFGLVQGSILASFCLALKALAHVAWAAW